MANNNLKTAKLLQIIHNKAFILCTSNNLQVKWCSISQYFAEPPLVTKHSPDIVHFYEYFQSIINISFNTR